MTSRRIPSRPQPSGDVAAVYECIDGAVRVIFGCACEPREAREEKIGFLTCAQCGSPIRLEQIGGAR